MPRIRWRLTTFRIIALAFLGIILTGTILLMLPVSTRPYGGTSYADAFFTATSATCVTGLIVRDTSTFWSDFGKSVIICMIQIGGIGVITAAVMLSVFMRRKISLGQRKIMQDSISVDNVGGIVKLTKFVVKGVILFELAGAAVLYPVFLREVGPIKAIAYSLFHSVSAFCNAGFDLMGYTERFSSLTHFQGNVLVNVTVIALILIGGIGFKTWGDIRTHGLRFRKYTLQSKLVLLLSVFFVAVPFVLYLAFEFGDLPAKERVLSALFQAVTPRTAGFNTADLNGLSEGGIALMIMLMLTGGASGSTAGGLKITTIAVLLCAAAAAFRNHKDTTAFGRRISSETVRTAATVLLMYHVLFLAAGIVISRIESLPLLTCLFETSSAIATVGLTLGITPGLSLVSRGILVALMFMGRVGGMTLLLSAFADKKVSSGRLPEENVNVG